MPDDAGGTGLTAAQREELLALARRSIREALSGRRQRRGAAAGPPAAPADRRGVFVTLRAGRALRGCIGMIEPVYPLGEAVFRMAREAALGDPRFSPLTLAELERVTVEISVLTPPRRVRSHEEITIPGDGVIVRRGGRQGVFLPQVAAESGWDRAAFLTALCERKAGLPPDAWRDPETELYVFRSEVFAEGEASR